ncbi:hypothetical protein MON38_13410 [Hymenobacter sp. DH14]|uniref:DUF2268 domain-containing protein n=1 Tax=Hymenobacter cyanobacteriorum TaxID=2926463 RepID=A0A9X2AG35_9BACT|nr:DUF5700 domain-containing putative Zn-dependent protease [Hymenobacter cyanobacteriorum]MCI1188422.1 hypothetical protein [Hymenobacter cyanobacteriorum]
MPRLRPTVFRLLFFGLSLLLAGPGRAQTVNVEAVTRYWEITDRLRQNQPITDEVWREFLEIPGNKVYVRGIYSADDLVRYRKALQIVYMPRYDSIRQVRLKAQSWYYVLINDYKEREPAYRNFVATVAKSPAALALMYQKAYEYLPARNHTKVANLNIYYGALGNDATSQQEGLFYSLRATFDANEVQAGILEGHEMHHQLRTGKDFGTIAADDQGLMEIITSTQSEGLADLIDKPATLALPGDTHGIREWALDPAPKFLHKMDSTIQARAAGGAPATGRYYRQLSNGSNGHVPGFFMARTIQRNGYTKQLIKTADDPFAFFYLYQQAAKKDKEHAPLFSDDAMRYLRTLEVRYTKARRPASAS